MQRLRVAALPLGWVSLVVAVMLVSYPVPAQDQERGVAVIERAEKRVALVIGNAGYPTAPLRNPVNDARAMGGALRRLGFEVVERHNATQKDMQRAIAEFGRKLAGGAVGLFFFAGHGIQVNGHNYLIPVDATIGAEAEVALEAISVDRVLDQIRENPLNLVILDACRNNPFERRWRSSGGAGLAPVLNAPTGTLIAYSTAPGKVASDGDGTNSLYTSELLKAIEAPGLKVEDVFKKVRAAVARQTRSEQIPWELSSLTGDFYFAPARLAAGMAALPSERPTVPVPVRPEATPSSEPAAPSPVANDCDRLAGIWERDRPGTREVFSEAIDSIHAVPACRAAVERFPQRARYHVQYGRALAKSGNDVEAVTWFRKAANAGHSRALSNLGLMYANGRGGLPKDDAEAVRWYRLSAEQGDPVGQANLAWMYERGRGLSKSETEAVRWYRSSAEQDYAEAQNGLGWIYADGRGGVPKDDTEAVRWFRKAADQGKASGQTSLGLMYENGRGGLPKDDAEALRWYRKAAEQDYARAQTNLAWMYENGRGGLPKDDAEAVRWYRKAAEQGYAGAQNNLGVMYRQGRGGLPKDDAEAARWYRKAADQGDVWAQNNLGWMYEEGRGVSKDHAEAVRWYRLAADQAHEDAGKNLKRMCGVLMKPATCSK